MSLDTFLKGEVDGTDFFEENYFTSGMTTLVDRAFRHLGGSSSGSSVFQLSQAMGGGKTHSMIALGLMARDAKLRASVMGEDDPAPKLGDCKVIGFNGRRTDAPGGIWGDLADQLGRADDFKSYTAGPLQAPGPEAWKKVLGEDPVLIFLDELPPYMEYAVSVAVGDGNLGTVTTAALANLFVAVADLSNVCLVLSDLAGTNYSIGQQGLEDAFNRAVQGVTSEATRIAVPITPVNPNGDELYHILRKRLFKEVAGEADIKAVATAYRDALSDAVKMNLTSSAPESLYSRCLDSYPFHPDLRELVGKFKENPGFQQTRGVIRLMQMVVADLYKSKKAEQLDLIHPYDIDLNNDEISSEVKTINPALSEAIAHDVARGGDAEVELIDKDNGNQDASDAARLILVASLSTTTGAIHGLREYQLVDCLQRPGRDLSTFKASVMDKLATRAWYLHNSADGRLFFKNQQNLAAKLRSTAQSLNTQTVDRMLRERLTQEFEPQLRDCYQNVAVLPPPDEVKIEQDKTTLVIVRPGGQASQLPISKDWQDWWSNQPFKNRVVFLTGSRDTFQKVLDSARQARALKSIEDELKAENTPPEDPQWRALDSLKDRVGLQFSAALKEAFDQTIYPSINSALRSSGIDLAFAGNQSGEATVRHTLENVQKFTTKIGEDSFRARAEGRLFGGTESKTVLWSDFKRAAATNTNWPLHKPSALDELKTECVRRDLWREEGSHVRRGPFAPPAPEVAIRVLSVDEDGDGKCYLKVEPLHADTIVFESGDSNATAGSPSVPTPSKFEATGLRYSFLAYDKEDPTRASVVCEWKAKITLKHQLHHRGDHYEVELKALPDNKGIVIKYSTDGTPPDSPHAAKYAGPVRVPDKCRVFTAIASAPTYDLRSEQVTISIPKKGEEDRTIDPTKPAQWRGRTKLDDAGSVWDFLSRMEKAGTVTAFDISLTAESDDGQQNLEYSGSLDAGYDAAALKAIADSMQAMVGSNSLRMTVSRLAFSSGQALLDWLKDAGHSFNLANVIQTP